MSQVKASSTAWKRLARDSDTNQHRVLTKFEPQELS